MDFFLKYTHHIIIYVAVLSYLTEEQTQLHHIDKFNFIIVIVQWSIPSSPPPCHGWLDSGRPVWRSGPAAVSPGQISSCVLPENTKVTYALK